MVDFSTPHGQRAAARLASEQVIWLATVSADGTPQPSPVWFLWHDGKALIFSEPNAKVRNIGRNPHVALHFNDADGGDVVVFTGTAMTENAMPAADVMAAYVAKYEQGIKSIGHTPETMVQQYSVAVYVTPDKLRGH